MLFPGQRNTRANNLKRFLDAFPDKSRTQNVMPVDDFLPCSPKHTRVELPAQLAAILDHVRARIRIGDRAIQKSLLQRGERVNSADVIHLTCLKLKASCFSCLRGEWP